MTEKILEYTRLVKRYSFLLMHSGVSWKPEYETEMKSLEKKLSFLKAEISKEGLYV